LHPVELKHHRQQLRGTRHDSKNAPAEAGALLTMGNQPTSDNPG
jgi:hypothetical protein